MDTPKPRTFISVKGIEYPVGPCGFIPASAMRKARQLYPGSIKHPERGPYTKGRNKRRKRFGGR